MVTIKYTTAHFMSAILYIIAYTPPSSPSSDKYPISKVLNFSYFFIKPSRKGKSTAINNELVELTAPKVDTLYK